jgi:hypothetical protein
MAMTSSPQEIDLVDKWEAERALAVAEAEAYERERAIARIRLLMRRYGLSHEDIGAVGAAEAMCLTSVHSSPVERE